MLVLYHKRNAVNKICDFRAGMFCTSNRFKEGKETSEQELLFSDDFFCTHLEEWMLGPPLKHAFVLHSICVKSAHTDCFSLCVRAVCTQFRCTFYGEISLLLPSSAGATKRAVLGAGSSKRSSWDFLAAPHLTPAAYGTADVTLRAQLLCSIRHPGAQEPLSRD